MAISNVADVTRLFVDIIQRAINASNEWLPPPPVLPEPPNRITIDGLGFYLYHVQENASYKNSPSPGNDYPPVRYTPMALNLYYQLSANSTRIDGEGAYDEQKMMSIAMKTLHEYPFIDDSTLHRDNTPIFPDRLMRKDNRFRISIQPIPYNEAVHNWTAGSAPIKLSAYYEISVALLEPDESRSYTGRVLTYGNYVFAEGAIQIFNTQSTISFRVPGEATDRQVQSQPAQAPPGNDLDFIAGGFQGDFIDLRLVCTKWQQPAMADATWNIRITASNRVTVTVQETAVEENTGNIVTVFPGLYAAQLIVTRNRRTPDGELKTFRNVSNEFPFIVLPRLDHLPVPVSNVVTVTGFIFKDPTPSDPLHDDLKTSVYIGNHALTRNNGAGFTAGQFRATAVNTLEINLPAGLTPGQVLPVRILVRGAESTPAWITIP